MSIERIRIATELSLALRRIFDDDEFVKGILILAETDDDKRKILDFIKSGDNVNVETVTVQAMNIDIDRYGNYNDREYD